MSLEITGDGVITLTTGGAISLRELPCFDCRLLSNQTVSPDVITLAQFQSSVDTNNYFNNSNYRFQPQIAGYYQINAAIWGVTTTYTTTSRIILYMYKNGNSYLTIANSPFWADANGLASGSSIVYLNGSTDFVDLRAGITAAGSPYFFTSGSYFSGFLIRAD